MPVPLPRRQREALGSLDTLLHDFGETWLVAELVQRGIIGNFAPNDIEECDIETALSEFFEDGQLTWAEQTQTTYESELRQLKVFLRQNSVKTVTELFHPTSLAEYLSATTIKESTRNKKISFLRSIHRFCRRQKWVEDSIPKILTTKNLGEDVPRALRKTSVDELYRLSRELRFGVRYTFFIHMALETGGRIGEITEIQLHDIHPSTNTITVYGKNHPDGRTLYVPESVMEELKKYIRIRFSTDIESATSAQLEWYLFSPDDEIDGRPKPPRINTYQKTFRRIVDKMETLSEEEKCHITFHSLRHTFATAAVKAHVDLHTLAKLLGHRNIESTRTYLSTFGNDMKDALRKMENSTKRGE